MIYLDTPAEVLFDRKEEGSIESLELQRQGYLRLDGTVPQFVLVDGDREPDIVLEDVAKVISDLYAAKKTNQ